MEGTHTRRHRVGLVLPEHSRCLVRPVRDSIDLLLLLPLAAMALYGPRRAGQGARQKGDLVASEYTMSSTSFAF